MNEPDSDDDRTRQAETTPARERLRPESASDEPDRLPIGTRLGELELTGFVGQGGFSMVYLAWDHSLERRVAVKEYMPSSLASRSGHSHVAARSERHRETFDAGLKSFVNEGKLLAQFDHPSLVKVYRFWEQNGTAYMAMPFYEGTTLKDTVLAMMGKPPDEEWLLRLLDPLTAALAVIHAEQCFHRDIAPDNVLLLKGSGRPLLLDFGAARRVIGDKTQALTVILKPGYAPVEQYAEDPHLRQGAWTDVYALAAVVYWSITGKTPPTSVGRMLSDAYVPLMQCARGRYSDQFLTAIDRALRVLPEQRTRSVDQLRSELGIAAGTEPATAPAIAHVDPEATVLQPKVARDSGGSAHETAVASKSRWALMAGGASAIVVLVSGAWWLTRPTAPPSPSAPKVASATPSPVPVSAPALPPVPAPKPLGAADVVSLLTAGSDPAIELTANRQTLRGNLQRVEYRSNEAGYAYLIGLDPAANELVILHPPSSRAAQKLPTRGQIDATQLASPVVARLYLVVAREPRDLLSAGWTRREEKWVRLLGTDPASHVTRVSDAWPNPRCANEAARCDSAYGMTEVIDVTKVIAAPQPAASPRKSASPKQPDDAAATPPDPAKTRAQAPATEVKPRPPAPPANAAQCAEILRRMSLGDTSAALIERLKTLGCR
jgi:serine/threonine protein kinase